MKHSNILFFKSKISFFLQEKQTKNKPEAKKYAHHPGDVPGRSEFRRPGAHHVFGCGPFPGSFCGTILCSAITEMLDLLKRIQEMSMLEIFYAKTWK